MSSVNISEESSNPQSVLSRYWGFDGFRPLQKEIIDQLLGGKDTLALLPTGGGKSICYQVPGLIHEGLCIVISPLLALINDQIEGLRSKGILAETVNSRLNYRDIDRVLDNCIYGKVKFLFVSPERIANDLFRTRIAKMNVSMIAVDEAHCISQWGHDFRPAYRKISELRDLVPETPILALTATATSHVVDDIQKQLKFNHLNVLRQSFYRSNITFRSKRTEDKRGALLRLVRDSQMGSGIVYVRNRRKCKELAELIQASGFKATYYHAGLNHVTRAKAQRSWMNGDSKWIVATNAFGMGIDKADVRTVLHYDISDGIESYYQEAGRAGRDGKNSEAIQLYNSSDLKDSLAKVIKSHPSADSVKNVYRVMSDSLKLATGSGEMETFSLDISALAKRCDLGIYQTMGALKSLEQSGYIQLHQGVSQPSRVKILATQKKIGELDKGGSPLAKLINSLIRSRSGLFSDATIVREEELALLTGTSSLEVCKLLNQAQKMGILEYQARSGKSSLSYLTGRLSTGDLRLNTALMHELRSRSLSRQLKLNQYIENILDCRSRQLMAYFDEEPEEDCGNCDVCEKMKSNSNRATSAEFVKAMRKFLKRPQELSALRTFCSDERRSKLLRWALDKKFVSIKDSKARWTGPAASS